MRGTAVYIHCTLYVCMYVCMWILLLVVLVLILMIIHCELDDWIFVCVDFH